jgi:transposase
MLVTLTPATRIFVAVAPMDLRRSFDGRNRVRLLWWDGSGLWMATKRLEGGTLSWPRGQEASVGLRPEELSALITGLEVTEKAGWYRR